MSRTSHGAALLLALVAGIGCGAEDPVATLVGQLESKDPDVRVAAADALRELGPTANSAVPALSKLLRDLHPTVRQASARALGDLGTESRSTVDALEKTLADSELSVRLTAAWSLVKLDPEGRKYVPLLTRAMASGEGGTIVAVGHMGPQFAWAVPTLTSLLGDHRPGVRRLAAEALAKIGPDAAAKSALQRAKRDPDDRVREAATAALNEK